MASAEALQMAAHQAAGSNAESFQLQQQLARHESAIAELKRLHNEEISSYVDEAYKNEEEIEKFEELYEQAKDQLADFKHEMSQEEEKKNKFHEASLARLEDTVSVLMETLVTETAALEEAKKASAEMQERAEKAESELECNKAAAAKADKDHLENQEKLQHKLDKLQVSYDEVMKQLSAKDQALPCQRGVVKKMAETSKADPLENQDGTRATIGVDDNYVPDMAASGPLSNMTSTGVLPQAGATAPSFPTDTSYEGSTRFTGPPGKTAPVGSMEASPDVKEDTLRKREERAAKALLRSVRSAAGSTPKKARHN